MQTRFSPKLPSSFLGSSIANASCTDLFENHIFCLALGISFRKGEIAKVFDRIVFMCELILLRNLRLFSQQDVNPQLSSFEK